MKKISWSSIRLLTIFALLIFLFSFSAKRNAKRKITKTEVVFIGENTLFIKPSTVNNLLTEKYGNIKNLKREKVDLSKLEKIINTHPMVEESNVFLSINGVLKTVVKQRLPIARVIDSINSYYIDKKGFKVPLSSNYSMRVPLVFGTIKSKDKTNLINLFCIIYEDSFLKQNIIGVQIMPNGNLIMLNRNYDFQIHFGNLDSVNRKFNNYKAFFQKAIEDDSLDKYKKIDLRFTNQVVCTK